MTTDVMLHIEEALDDEARQRLITALSEQLGVAPEVRTSERPHLLFLPADLERAPPHRVLAAVRAQGYHARIVDL